MKRSVRIVFSLITASSLVLGCHEAASPTAPVVDINGAWSGTFSPGYGWDCSYNATATATFAQSGAAVSGMISVQLDCGKFDFDLQGALKGNTLIGSLTNGVVVAGRLSGGILEIILTQPGNSIPWNFGEGTLRLSR